MKKCCYVLLLLVLFPMNVHADGNEHPAKVIVITGSASGIGKAVAEKLIAKDHIVYGGDIDEANNQYLEELGGHALVMDVRRDEQVRAGIQRVLEEQGRIDVLINNAGYGELDTIETMPIEDLKNQFDVNVFGYARLQQAVLPTMRQQRSGRVILISSGLGKYAMPVLGWYAATKHAVEGMADALRQEVRAFNIDVVTIRPGGVKTNFMPTAHATWDPSVVPEDYQPLVERTMANLDSIMSNAPGPEHIAGIIVNAVEVVEPKESY